MDFSTSSVITGCKAKFLEGKFSDNRGCVLLPESERLVSLTKVKPFKWDSLSVIDCYTYKKSNPTKMLYFIRK